MYRLATAVAAATISFGLSSPAGAADFLNACAADVAQYCDAVEPGHGRMASCLYAHETAISDACYLATSDLGDFLDSMFSGVRVILQACGGDIQNHCSDVQAGDGRIFSCLAEHKSDLSQSCEPAVEQFSAILPADAPAQ